MKITSGWWLSRPYPSEKYEFVSWDDDIPNIWKNKKCSKLPIRHSSNQNQSNNMNGIRMDKMKMFGCAQRIKKKQMILYRFPNRSGFPFGNIKKEKSSAPHWMLPGYPRLVKRK
jgi:hypothetical protein